LNEVLHFFCYVMCNGELIPIGVCFQDRPQVMDLFDPRVSASQNN